MCCFYQHYNQNKTLLPYEMYIETSEKNEIGLIASYVMNIVLFGMQFSYFENNHLIPIIFPINKLKSLANQSTLYFNTSM